MDIFWQELEKRRARESGHMALVAMRLADMRVVHPAQDNSRVCVECGAPVGIYPSGQRALRRYPKMRVMCAVCAFKEPPEDLEMMPAATPAELAQESRARRPVGKA